MKAGTASLIFSIMSFCFVVSMFYITIGTDIKRNIVEKKVRKEALKGNKFAIKLMKRPSIFRWDDRETIYEAMKGNENALEMLGIEMKDENEKNYFKY